MGMNYRDGVTQAMDEFDKSQVCEHHPWVSKAVSTLWLPLEEALLAQKGYPLLAPSHILLTRS